MLLTGGSPSTLSLGINVNAVDYWTTALMFNDVMKYAYDGWNVVKANSVGFPWNVSGASLPAMDQNGYPIGLGDLKAQGYGLMTYAFTQPLMSYPTGSYTLTFDGKGTVVVTQLGGSQDSGTFTQDGGAGQPHTVNIGASKTGILIAITDSDPTDYVRNIRLIMPGYQDSYQTQPFYQPFMQGLQPFSTLRFMDTMETNDQDITDWSQRTTGNYRTQTKDTGVAVEYMVQLANELHKDMWVNMPYKANDAYVQGFAQYVHDHLDPALKVYVEYGNEDWNAAPGFHDAYQYVFDYSQAHGLNFPQATADLAKHDWDIWRNIYGEQTGTTFMRVAANQFSLPWALDQEIARLVATADPSDPDHGFEVVSGAPYFLPNSSKYDASTTTQQIVADALNAATGFGGMIDAFMAVRNKWQQALNQTIPAIMYEGGFALTASPSSPWYNAYLGTQTDPGMYAVNMAYLDELHQHGVDGLMYYSYITVIGQYGPWGAMQALDEPTAQTPKYNALVDYAAGRSGFDSLARFSVTGLADATAGTTQTITVTALDSAGATFTGYLGTVHFSSSDIKAGLPADYVFTPADHGVHTFTVTLKSAGSQSVTASDLAYSQLAGTQSGITIAPASAGAFRVNGFPASVAGVPHNFTVTVTDIYGNPTSDYTGTVRFTTTDWQGVLPANYTFTLVDAGVHTFTATLKAANTQSITVTDTTRSSMTGSQTGIVVSAAPFNAYTIWPYPNTATTGVAYSYTITATDGYHNTITGYTGTVHFSSSDAQAILPPDYTFTAADKGNHVFKVTLNSGGSRSVTVNDVTKTSAIGRVYVQVIKAVAGSVDLGVIPTEWTAGSAEAITVTILDTNGAPLAGYTGTIHFTSTDPLAVLPADYTFTTADQGTHTFTVTLKTAGDQGITITDTVSAGVTGSQSGITVSAGSTAGSVDIAAPAVVVAGAAQTYSLTVRDAYGNVMTGYTGTVHFTSTDPLAVLPADYTFTTSDQGTHNFYATLKTAGSQSITVTDTAVASVTGEQTGITVTAAATAGTITMSASTAVIAGSTHVYAVTVRDAYGNVMTGYTGTVHFTSTDLQAALPTDYAFTVGDQGSHNFIATLKTAGSQSVSVADTAHALSATQAGISVSPANATAIVVNTSTTATAGTPQNYNVTVRDAYGNIVTGYAGTVHFTSTDSQAVLPSNYTFTNNDNGVHTFSVTLKTAGSQSVTVTDTTITSITGTQAGIAVSSANVTGSIGISAPAVVVAGVGQTYSLTVRDAYGNVMTGYTGTVHFTSTDLQAALPADYAFTASDQGSHNFIATLKTAGSQSVSVADTAHALSAAQAGVSVSPASAAAISVNAPATATAGTPQNYTLTVRDAYGNAVTGYTGTVRVTSTDPQAVLPPNYTFAAVDKGVHVFTATLKTAGSQSITVTDTVTASITGKQAGIAVSPANVAGSIAISAPAASAAGIVQTYTVTARDAYGNVMTGYAGTVHFTSTDPLAVLPADYTFTMSDQGTHNFYATLKTAGSQSVSVADIVTSLSSTQSGISVSPASASTITVNAPATAVAGAPQSFTVTLKDAYGNLATGYAGTVHFTSTDPQASLPSNYTFTSNDNGVHTFSITLKTTGNRSVTVTDTAIASISGTQAGIAVSPANVAGSIAISAPTASAAGATWTYTVTVRDAYGNVMTGYAGTVHFTSTDPLAVLPADYTFTTSDQGTHNFYATLKTAGSQSVSVADIVTSLSSTQSGISVSPASASTITVNAPATAVAGTSQNYTLTAKDAYGNIATGYAGTVHFASTDPQAVLPSDYTFAATDKGIHSFAVILKTAGSQSITVTDTVAASITGEQAGIAVSSASVAGSIAVSGPAASAAGVTQTYTVTVRDPYGNIMTGYADAVRLTSSDSRAILPSAYTFTAADQGVHQFNITLSTAGMQSVSVTSTTDASLSDTQSGIRVTPSAATRLALSASGVTTAGAPALMTVSVRDAYDNVVSGFTGTVRFTSSDPAATVPSPYTFTASDQGTHTFAIPFKTAGAQSVSVTSPTTPALTAAQSNVTVSPGAFASFQLGLPSTSTAGTATPVTVSARDAYNNVVSGFTGPVHIESTDTPAGMSTGYFFTAADNGIHSFSMVFKTAGPQTLTVWGATGQTAPAARSTTTVMPGLATTFQIIGLPTSATAGAPFHVTVTARDAFGNIATGYSGTVRFASTDRRAQLPPSYTFSGYDQGVHTFVSSMTTSGSQAITVADTASSAVAGTTMVSVKAGVAASLQVLDQSASSTVSGTPRTIVVIARDVFGNIATGYTGTIAFQSNDLLAILPADYTFTAADNGIRSFTIVPRRPGQFSLSVRDTRNGGLASGLDSVLVR